MYSENRLPTYRFVLNDGVESHIVTPNYDDSLSLKTAIEAGKYYYRDELNGDLLFMRDDVDLINDASFEVEFLLELQEQIDGEYVKIWEGIFSKIDGRFNPDVFGRNVSISPETNDNYTLLEAGLDREFDLIELGINKNEVHYLRQPLLQVYQIGSSYVTNFVRTGVSWEQEVSENTLSSFDLERDHLFLNQPIANADRDNGNKLFVTGFGAGLVPDVSGEYDFPEYTKTTSPNFIYINIGRTPIDGITSIFITMKVPIASSIDDQDDFLSVWSVDGNDYHFVGAVDIEGDSLNRRLYFAAFSGSGFPSSTGQIVHISGAVNTQSINYIDFEREVDAELSYYRYGIYDQTLGSYAYVANTSNRTIRQYTIESNADLSGEIMFSRTSDSKCRLIWGSYFCRIFSDLETLEGEPTLPNPQLEGIPSASGYSRVTPFSFGRFVIQDGHNNVGGRLGKFDDEAANFAGEYFSEGFGPYINTSGYPNIQYLPVNRREWSDASQFMAFTPRLHDIMNSGGTRLLLRHAYAFHEVIQLLLNEIDPELTFTNTIEHSEFLYSGVNPVSGDPQPNIWLTPKSNVLRGSYDRPASRAPIKLGDLLSAWELIYKGGYHITADKKLILEHASWYENGGSYTEEIIGQDITELINVRNRKKISFGQNQHDFIKEEIPEQITTRWMDDVSELFEGFPIEIKSKSATRGKIDDLRVGIITTDLDFAQTNPNTFSQEGWFMLATLPNNLGEEHVQFVDIDLGPNQKFSLQNGYLSNIYLHDKFYRDSMPAELLEINRVEVTANSIKRNKVQDVNTPIKIEDPNKLIKTNLGLGKIVEHTRNITKFENTTTIRHEQ